MPRMTLFPLDLNGRLLIGLLLAGLCSFKTCLAVVEILVVGVEGNVLSFLAKL